MIRVSILIILALAITSCVATKSGAYRIFAEDLERLVGSNFQESYVFNIGYLAKLQPDDTKPLSNGNVIKIFSVKPPRKENCKVHIEVNDKDIIIVAFSEGTECWRAY